MKSIMTKNNSFFSSKAIIIDSGTAFTKSGFVGEASPRSVIPTVIGYPKSELNRTKLEFYYIGEDALQLREVLKLKYPIEHSQIEDWDAMEKIWNYIFHNDLKINPMLHPIILTGSLFDLDRE